MKTPAKARAARRVPPPGLLRLNRYLLAALLAAFSLVSLAAGLYLHYLVGLGLLVLILLGAWFGVVLARQMKRAARDRARQVARLRYAEARTRNVLATAGDGIITVDEAGIIKSFNRAAARIFGYRPREILGKRIALLLSPHGAALIDTGEARILGADGELEGRRKDGRTFPVEPALSKIRVGRRKRYTYILRDLTDQRRHEEDLRQARDELEARVAERTAQLARANEELQAEVGRRQAAQAALENLSRQTRLILQAAGEGIVGLDRAGNITFANPAAAHLGGYSDGELIGRPFRDTLYPPDPSAPAEAPESAVHRADGALFRRKDGCWFPVQYIRTPLREGGAVVGAVVTFQDISERQKTERALQDYAEQLRALSRQLLEVQETERRHLARELHDEIGQTLTALKLNLEGIGRAWPAGQLPPALEDSLAVVDQAISEVRNLSLDLRPSLLDDLGLVPALRWYVERQAQRGGFTTRLDAGLQERLPPPLETACFRLVQEALTNVMRHAAARHVEVLLWRDGGVVELVVRDDGAGFDVAEARQRAAGGASLGLLGMQERVQLLGGTIEVHSAPGHGTQIRAHFPAPAEGAPS
jgi:PAS domain S-box-containing protein